MRHFLNLSILFVFCSFLNAQELTKSGDYVVDKTNNKMWQDTKENIELRLYQKNAKKYCQKLNLAGFGNWHLPTRKELKQIVDMGRKDEFKISKAFSFALPDDYWTQDVTWRSLGQYGYYIYFKSGTVYYQNKNYPKYVRCVRDMK